MKDQEQPSNSDILGEDPMIDSLLAEVFGKSTPPDLSSTIMRRLHESPIVTRPTGVSQRASGMRGPLGESSQGTATVAAKKQSNWMTQAVLAVVALAASLGMVIVAWNIYQPKTLDYSSVANAKKPAELAPKKTSVAQSLPVEATESPIQSPRPNRTEPRGTEPRGTEPRGTEPRGITIARDNANLNPVDVEADAVPPLVQRNPRDVPAVQLVSSQASKGLASYWNAVGVQPSATATGEDIRARLKARLQVDLEPTWFALGKNSIVESATAEIESALRSDINASRVARAWLDQITSGSIQQLPEDDRQLLVTELTVAFQGKQSLDTLISSWLRGDSAGASAWYAAATQGGEYAMVHRLASLTMNVDLRCTRCHDALIESDGRQHDYWSFAAVLRRDLARDENGRWSVLDEQSNTKKPSKVFYERPDGRQTIAEPKVPSSWLVRAASNAPDANAPDAASGSQQEVKTVRQWSEAIVGSRSLAHGVVNSLWRLVHDRPLRGVVADASSPPLDDALVQLEELLVDDLVASNFDASRLLAIILSSPATSRSIPEMLVRQDAWALDAGNVRLAEQAVEAFAATAPSPKLLPLKKRFDISMRSIGATLKGMDSTNTVLAQPLGQETSGQETSGKEKQPRESSTMASGFPDHADGLPVQWLASIASFDSQVKHVGYLAAAEQLPPGVVAVAQAMQKANVAPELTLHRVWWLLQP